jgi:putative ABC transport system permease protein
MLRHLFKLMWNKKGSHTLLIVEILASFLVLFGVTSLIVYNLNNYRQPLGFDYQNVWVVSMDRNGTPDSVAVPLKEQIKARMRNYPQVESAAYFSFNTPYSMNTAGGGVSNGTVNVQIDHFHTDLDMVRTLNVPIAEGRWFDRSDEAPDARTVVINQALKEALFGDEPALGKRIFFGGEDAKPKQDEYYRIVGLVNNFKSYGEFEKPRPGVFQLAKGDSRLNASKLLLRVQPGTNANFEAQLVKDLGAITNGWATEVSYLENQRDKVKNITLVPVIIFLVVSGFLLINVALGLFGILNVSIAKRRSEIGLRRALGATGQGISRQFVGEMWVLTTFGLTIGLLFALQFPLLNVFDLAPGVYLTAIGIATLAIFAIVTACAYYPSRQAATIQPATALHAE